MAATIKASDLLIKALEHEGVEYIFAVPGEENLDVLESLRTSKIRLILTRHEQGAAFMAATYGRMTGRTGVCMATLGPGATNFVTSAAYAQLGAMPMLMLTGQKPIKQSKQGHFQIVDVVRMMEPLTKMTKQIVDAVRIPSLVREAFRIAEEERPGAVHLELPEDVAAEQTDDWWLYKPMPIQLPCATDEAVSRAADMIAAAKNPLLLIGAGANRKGLVSPLTRFVEELEMPFFNTQMGKGVISCNTTGFMGTAALSDNDLIHEVVNESDLVINVGHDIIEKPPFFMRDGDNRKVIHVNFYAANVDPVYFPNLEVIGEIGNSIGRLHRLLADKGIKGQLEQMGRLRTKIAAQLHSDDGDDGFPVKPQRLVAEIRRAVPDDGVIALDNGVYKVWFARNYPTYMPNTVLLDNALATMGAGLPSAMMVALMEPQRKVVAICGDGGFMMNSQEMETAVRLKLNLVVAVLRDNSYGMIRWKQAHAGFADWGLEYGNPDFVLYAESYGAQGHRVASAADVSQTLRQCFEQGGVHLVEIPVDYSENSKI